MTHHSHIDLYKHATTAQKRARAVSSCKEVKRHALKTDVREMNFKGHKQQTDKHRPQVYSVRSEVGSPAQQAVLLRMQGGCEVCEVVEEEGCGREVALWL